MPPVAFRPSTALVFVAVALVPSAALAQDTTCRGGLFTQQESLAQAVVAEPRRTFFYRDTEGCPTMGECRTNSYVIEGDMLVIGRSHGEFVCAFFANDQGGTAGWVRRNRLTIVPTDIAPPQGRWKGEWTDGGSADLSIASRGGSMVIAGNAFWPARPEQNTWPTIHIGEVDGALAISGNYATYADDNLCELDLTLLADFLLIEDNRQCGGANVTFSGVYRRAGSARQGS